MKPMYEGVEVQLHVLNLGTRLRLVFNYTARSLYPRGKRPRNAFSRRQSRSQSQSARYGERKPLAFDGNQHSSLVNRWQPSHGAPTQFLCYLRKMDPEKLTFSYPFLRSQTFSSLH